MSSGLPTLKPKIFLSPPHMSGTEVDYVHEAFATNWIAPLGPHVDAFEKELAAYVGAGEAVAVSSGTAAIHLALSLLDTGPGDTVFCSSLTFIASANPIRYLGAHPVFIDSEPESWNMSPQALERAFHDAAAEGTLPKAVIVVHLYGQSARMDELLEICGRYHVPLIEDSAESLGSTYKGRASGVLGKFGIYSFNGNKIITTSGGGMLVSDDKAAIQKARFLAAQAKEPVPYYHHEQLGYNYRMSNILAGVGRAQLEVLADRVNQRRAVNAHYVEQLAHLPGIHFMPQLEFTRPNCWLTALILDQQVTGISIPELLEGFAAENIEARHVWKPLHLQPVFAGTRYYPHREEDSVSERLFRYGLCLPSGSSMTEEQQARVVDCFKSVMMLQQKI